MDGIRKWLKRTSTPVTIMLVPHSRSRCISVKVPVAGIAASGLMFLVGVVYVAVLSVHAAEYYLMKDRLAYLTSQFNELEGTLESLRRAEGSFRKLFSLRSKEEVLETADLADAGSLDMDALRAQIKEAVESVADIRTYVAAQRDLYLATPAGWPVAGRVSSAYGGREHPTSGAPQFHTGIDLSVPQGTRVQGTADGIVSFSGFTQGSGNAVVVEHGHGFSTVYAHNSRNLVRVGDRVKRGDAIAISGSTGISTGPHVHYEIWKGGRHVNPGAYAARR